MAARHSIPAVPEERTADNDPDCEGPSAASGESPEKEPRAINTEEEEQDCKLDSSGFQALRARRCPGSLASTNTGPEIATDGLTPAGNDGARRPFSVASLATPSSSSSAHYKITPGTPLPERSDLKLIVGDVGAIIFDFDGTLTATPGDSAVRWKKQEELKERATFLRPRLQRLVEAGITLGIMTKSSERTVTEALENAELTELFEGPIVAKAIGFEGKAGHIEELAQTGRLKNLGAEGAKRVVLVDDDVLELDRARGKGIQTYAAPQEGGLQVEDFEEIFRGVGLSPDSSR